MTNKPFELLEHYEVAGQTDITAEAVVIAYVHDYVPALQAGKLPAIQLKMEQGKALILEGLSEFYSLQDDYRATTNRIWEVNQTAARETGNSYIIYSPFSNHKELSGFSETIFQRQLSDIKGSR